MRSSSIAAPYMRASTGNSSLTACSEGSNRGGALHQWDSVSGGKLYQSMPWNTVGSFCFPLLDKPLILLLTGNPARCAKVNG